MDLNEDEANTTILTNGFTILKVEIQQKTKIVNL